MLGRGARPARRRARAPQRAVEGHERPRQQHEVARQADPELATAGARGPAAPSGRRRRSGRTWSAISRASARSSRSGDTVSAMSATRSMPSRSRLTSRRTRAARMSTTAACWIGSSRPTAPKSMSPSVPSREDEDVARVRVGVEEAEPQHLVERRAQQLLGERRARSIACVVELRGVGHGEALEALLHEQPPGAELRWTPRDPHRRAPVRAAAPSRPSRRPRGGSRARPAGSRRTGRASRPTARPGRTSVRRCARSASSASAARSRSMTSSMPGRWTLTTTASPVCSRAR